MPGTIQTRRPRQNTKAPEGTAGAATARVAGGVIGLPPASAHWPFLGSGAHRGGADHGRVERRCYWRHMGSRGGKHPGIEAKIYKKLERNYLLAVHAHDGKGSIVRRVYKSTPGYFDDEPVFHARTRGRPPGHRPSRSRPWLLIPAEGASFAGLRAAITRAFMPTPRGSLWGVVALINTLEFRAICGPFTAVPGMRPIHCPSDARPLPAPPS
jgi:hypothetical protein